MRAIKIPNTMHFKDVTKIEDAVRLYDKLKRDAVTQQFDPANEMECEDAAGNVLRMHCWASQKPPLSPIPNVHICERVSPDLRIPFPFCRPRHPLSPRFILFLLFAFCTYMYLAYLPAGRSLWC